jgi:hypothetical protein
MLDGKQSELFAVRAPGNIAEKKQFIMYLAIFPFRIQSAGDDKLLLDEGRKMVF